MHDFWPSSTQNILVQSTGAPVPILLYTTLHLFTLFSLYIVIIVCCLPHIVRKGTRYFFYVFWSFSATQPGVIKNDARKFVLILLLFRLKVMQQKATMV